MYCVCVCVCLCVQELMEHVGADVLEWPNVYACMRAGVRFGDMRRRW